MDIVDTATRSRMMSSVPRRDSKPEVELRRALHSLRLRFRVHVKDLPGTPDIVFPRHRAVVFVHGCFWHDHGCTRSTKPATSAEFWATKFAANRERDARKAGALRDAGWRVATVWECALRGRRSDPVAAAHAVREWTLQGGEPSLEIRAEPPTGGRIVRSQSPA